MIKYDDKELQAAADRLMRNRDFLTIAEVLQEDYRMTAFYSEPDASKLREHCYQRHAVLEEFKAVVTELLRSKQDREKYHG